MPKSRRSHSKSMSHKSKHAGFAGGARRRSRKSKADDGVKRRSKLSRKSGSKASRKSGSKSSRKSGSKSGSKKRRSTKRH